MKKYIALRMRNLRDARLAIRNQGATLTRVLSNAMEPALRNLIEGLHKRGLATSISGATLYWLLIDDEQSCQYYQTFNEVEFCFDWEWFEAQTSQIRGLSGVEYCDACENIGRHWVIKSAERPIDYQIPKVLMFSD